MDQDMNGDIDTPLPMPPIEVRLVRLIRPYFSLVSLVRDLRQGEYKAVEPAARALLEIETWLKE